jgi:hypothetical protein
MISAKKIESNRKNAQKSTGPRTPEGNARASRNALRHGLTAKDALLPGENEEAFVELQETLFEEFKPVGGYEADLVDVLILMRWRHRRAGRLEAALFRKELDQLEYSSLSTSLTPSFMVRGLPVPPGCEPVAPLSKEETKATVKKMNKLRDSMREERIFAAYLSGSSGEDKLGKLIRYETGFERAFYRALHELERHQLRRHGEKVDAPVAIDIDLNLEPPEDASAARSDEHVIDVKICETNPSRTTDASAAALIDATEDPSRGPVKNVETPANATTSKLRNESNDARRERTERAMFK